MKGKKAYKDVGLVGSDHKDIVDSAQGKVIGAWLNSFDHAARHDVTTLGGPRSKFYRSDATVILEYSRKFVGHDLLHVWTVYTGGPFLSRVFCLKEKTQTANHSRWLEDFGCLKGFDEWDTCGKTC